VPQVVSNTSAINPAQLPKPAQDQALIQAEQLHPNQTVFGQPRSAQVLDRPIERPAGVAGCGDHGQQKMATALLKLWRRQDQGRATFLDRAIREGKRDANQ
jgi:hypothetical protein